MEPVDHSVLDELRRQLVRERKLLKRLLEALELHGGGPSAEEAQLLAASEDARALTRDLVRVLGHKFTLKVALVGDYSAGKSSFINHLLEDDTLCPVRDDPTTSHVTVFKYGASEQIVSTAPNGKTTQLTREQYTQRVQSSGTARDGRQPFRFLFQAPLPALEGLEVLDTPGFSNLNNAGDTAVTESVLGEADVILFLVDINNGTIPDSSVQRLRTLRERVPQAHLRVLLTKCDTKAPSRVRTLLEECQREHGALVDGEVLSYSTCTLGQRPDVCTREGMLFFLQRRLALRLQAVENQLLARVREHVAARRLLLPPLELLLKDLSKTQQRRVTRVSASEARLRKSFDYLQSELSSRYRAEVCKALQASFRVEELPKTGWFYKDARIVRVGPMLPSALSMFNSVRDLRVGLASEIKQHLREHTEDALALAAETCERAREDTARAAGKLMEKHLGPLSLGKYDYANDANALLQQALDKHAQTIAAQLWDDWSRWLEGLYELLVTHYVTPVVREAQAHLQLLDGLLESYRNLVADNLPLLETA